MNIVSNRELRTHLLSDHSMTPPEYFEKHPNANKFCSKCKKEIPIAEFFMDKDNTFGYRTQCISCMRPSGKKRTCPLCNRVLQWSAIITHLKNDHGISPIDGYRIHLKEKYCPKCKTVKPLDEFSPLADENSVYFSWCKQCNLDRSLERIYKDKDFRLAELLVIRLAFGDKCFICGMDHDESLKQFGEPLHIDHIVPHIKDKTLSLGNASVLCKECNLKKGSRTMEQLLKSKYPDRVSQSSELDRLVSILSWADKELKRLILWESWRSRNFSDTRQDQMGS